MSKNVLGNSWYIEINQLQKKKLNTYSTPNGNIVTIHNFFISSYNSTTNGYIGSDC